ncbi:hypothetical protein [Trichormus sp. NMC-1]|uniref:hypothetical protein n=1 Tax=Trichormus sp. NMC-1 TaxID=1853259 RepID=UPI0008DC0E66|nr:hypothetical protein [Trichormus sp. NMC-1]
MLLTQVIASQQTAYAELQSQIEELQQQQREIQAYLQQLGSIESKMVSALQMVQEAVGEIREICPGELGNYQASIDALFGDAPIAVLSAAIEPITTPETTETTTTDTQPTETEPQPQPETDTTEPTTDDTQTEPETNPTDLITKIKSKASTELKWQDYKKFINSYSLPETIARKPKNEIENIFDQFLKTCDMATLQAILTSLNNQISEKQAR